MQTVRVEEGGSLEAVVTAVLAEANTLSSSAVVVGLQGDLGAGKTTLVQEIARTLGVAATVTSPTFVIQKQYDTTNDRWTTLVHMDAYRLEEVSELIPLKFSQLVETPQTLCCIEWVDRVVDALPTPYVMVDIALAAGTRTFSIYVKTD